MIIKLSKIIYLFAAIILFSTQIMKADINRSAAKKDKGNQTQRASRGLFDLQENTVSNIQFFTTNYGIFGFNVAQQQGGGYWPRGSLNQYIFAGGIWFGAQRLRPDTAVMRKYVTISYNPSNGRSWLVPGSITDEDSYLAKLEETQKYRTYFSTDFKTNSGVPLNPADGPNWPIWDTKGDQDTLKKDRYFGKYVEDENKRNSVEYPKGPAFISGEDIFAIYKDTDLGYYDGGATKREQEGYPLYLEYHQTIYSWGFGDYRDFIFIAYDIINKSGKPLYECWMAPVMDVDIARAPNTAFGAGNDRVAYYEADTTLNLAYQWTNPDRGEGGNGFGYLGFDFLESPAIITTGDSLFYIRKDSAFYDNTSQLGLVTFRNWPITEDVLDDDNRYNYMALGVRDGDNGAGDKRFLMATGPFHMRPNDTVRVVVGMILAAPAVRKDADGTPEDAAGLVEKDEFAQKVYDNNFSAPKPPDRAEIKNWQPLNHGIKLTWDSTSEMSTDKYENGLDFLGYKIYRARRTDLDTFDVDNIENQNRGPYGWKQIAEWKMPTPFLKSYVKAGSPNDKEAASMPFIDSLRIIGPYYDDNGIDVKDSMAIVVMRIGQGVNLLTDKEVRILSSDVGFRFPKIRNSVVPVIASIDTSIGNQPWGPLYKKYMDQIKPSDYIYQRNNGDIIPFLHYDPVKHYKLFDSILVGIVQITPAFLPYNPLFFKKYSKDITPNEYANLPENGIIYRQIEKDSVRLDTDGNPELDKNGNVVKDTFKINTTTVDAVYKMDTFLKSESGGPNDYTISVLLPRAVQNIMSDSLHVRETLETLYGLIKKNNATVKFPEFEQTMEVKNEIIVPYMSKITNNRTFIDIGDDNKDGLLRPDPDPAKSEVLINNVDYFYKVLAFDEGDFGQPTPLKTNDGSEGLPNLVKSYPRAARAANKSEFEIIHVDSSLIGGLYNFNFFSLDNDRVKQNFDGHILELEFQPYWQLLQFRYSDGETYNTAFYNRRMTLTDTTTGDLLFDGTTYLGSVLCPRFTKDFQGNFSESGSGFIFSNDVITDPITGNEINFSLPHNRDEIGRKGEFTSGTFNQSGFCYAKNMLPPAYGTLGFSFEYYLKQYGGIYRPDALTTGKDPSVEATTPVVFSKYPTGPVAEDPDLILTTQLVDYSYYRKERQMAFGSAIYGSFNNGPAHYVVEFTEGGDTLMELRWGGVPPKDENVATFKVSYLNLKVTNTFDYYRPGNDGDSVLVSYAKEVPHMMIDTIGERTIIPGLPPVKARYYPDPRNLPAHGINTNDFIGKFNIAAYGWIRPLKKPTRFDLPKILTRPATGGLSDKKETYTGYQGKYFLSAVSQDGKDTLDFVHIFNGSGVQFAFDYANQGKPFGFNNEWTPIDWDKYTYGPDFKPGDKVYLNTFGGATGYPLPGAKVLVRIGRTDTSVAPKMTDNVMDQIRVVPNPYYITHIGQNTPYDAKIYFTKLPKRCTIDIYTVTGDLVKTLEHNESTSPEISKESVEVWDLLSKNEQRVQSQTLIALITSPNGSQTVQKFTIVVGGFRLVND